MTIKSTCKLTLMLFTPVRKTNLSLWVQITILKKQAIELKGSKNIFLQVVFLVTYCVVHNLIVIIILKLPGNQIYTLLKNGSERKFLILNSGIQMRIKKGEELLHKQVDSKGKLNCKAQRMSIYLFISIKFIYLHSMPKIFHKKILWREWHPHQFWLLSARLTLLYKVSE